MRSVYELVGVPRSAIYYMSLLYDWLKVLVQNAARLLECLFGARESFATLIS